MWIGGIAATVFLGLTWLGLRAPLTLPLMVAYALAGATGFFSALRFALLLRERLQLRATEKSLARKEARMLGGTIDE